MTSFQRRIALLLVAAALTAIATPMMAACRFNSSLDITQIIDPPGPR